MTPAPRVGHWGESELEREGKTVDEFVSVKITRRRWRELVMLMDWQLRELGFDPSSIPAISDIQNGQPEPTEAEIQAALDFGRTAERHLC